MTHIFSPNIRAREKVNVEGEKGLGKEGCGCENQHPLPGLEKEAKVFLVGQA